mmetsp:Transcript_34042/g.62297  ORF Transcript_34042/g.62297 Transcript_34042/m.62297 type:complete len:282 (+) Transcript_34042:373-1218(+)
MSTYGTASVSMQLMAMAAASFTAGCGCSRNSATFIAELALGNVAQAHLPKVDRPAATTRRGASVSSVSTASWYFAPSAPSAAKASKQQICISLSELARHSTRPEAAESTLREPSATAAAQQTLRKPGSTLASSPALCMTSIPSSFASSCSIPFSAEAYELMAGPMLANAMAAAQRTPGLLPVSFCPIEEPTDSAWVPSFLMHRRAAALTAKLSCPIPSAAALTFCTMVTGSLSDRPSSAAARMLASFEVSLAKSDAPKLISGARSTETHHSPPAARSMPPK